MFPLKLFLFASSDFSNLCLQRFINEKFLSRAKLLPEGVGGGALPYMGYKGICGPKGYGFLAVLVWNRASIVTILVWNRVWFMHSSLKLGMFFRRSYFLIIRRSGRQQKPFSNCYANRVTAKIGRLLVWNRVSNFFGQVWNRVGKTIPAAQVSCVVQQGPVVRKPINLIQD